MSQVETQDVSLKPEKPKVSKVAACVEPEFLVSHPNDLQLGLLKKGPETAQYIDYQVIRRPTILSNHVKRILLYVNLADADKLYGGLIDLFIVLDGRGENLRHRMLQVAKSVLDEGRYVALRDCDGQINSSDHKLPASRDSLLDAGLVGTSLLLNSTNQSLPSDVERDPLLEAREYIEYSQIDLARGVLEKAILKDPNRQDLQQDLLDILRSTNDESRFEQFRAKLDEMSNPHADLWEAFSRKLDSVK